MTELYAFIAGMVLMGLLQEIRPTRKPKEK